MATTYQEHTGNASTTTFSYPFPVLKTEDIKVALNGVTQTTGYTATTSPAQVVFSSAPASGVVVRVYRDTDVDSAKGVFAAGSSIRAVDLNNNQDQVLYALQEEQNQKGIFEEIKLDDDVKIKLGNSAGDAEIYYKDNNFLQIESNGSIVLDTDAGNFVVSDGGVAKFGWSSNSALGVYVVDHIRPFADNTYDLGSSSKEWKDLYVDGTGYIDTIDADNIIVSGNVDGRDVSADGTKLDTIETNAKDDQTAAEIKTLLQSNKLTDSEITAGTLDNRYYTETELTNGQLDGRYYTETELLNGALDGRYFTETEADARYYNLASAEEIQSGETWTAADDKVATTAAIDARIVDLVDDVGGFVPIANETSFPNANPDINNGAGTLISVPLANNLTSNGSGVISISNGTVGNSTVTINGAANSTTYTQGFGIIVETTTTLNTYTFHRYVPKATEITTVAGNIPNITTVGGISANVTTVAGVASNVTTVAGVASNVTTVAGIASTVTAVAADAADIGAVAGKATEIGRLGTTDAVADLALLGTAAVVEDLNLLGTTAAIADMELLGDSAVIADMATIADTSNLITNIGTVAGIQADVTTVAGDTTAINNITTNLSAVQGAATNATNAASSATAAASSATGAATSATTATTQATTATTQATTATTQASTATTQATNAATSATSSASSASTSTAQASTATTQATNSATSASTANAHQLLAKQYRDTTSGILTQTKSIAYNLVDSASSHTAWGNITDGGTADFAGETSNTFLTMAEGSATYNYGSIT